MFPVAPLNAADVVVSDRELATGYVVLDEVADKVIVQIYVEGFRHALLFFLTQPQATTTAA